MIKGLYIHFPYCKQVCHYCDFAKTAHYGADHLLSYQRALTADLSHWLPQYETKLSSVFLGGGTPSLWTDEWQNVLDMVRPYLEKDAEISIEANPDDLNDASLKAWQQAGINRLSVGVQTFDPTGLRFLNRVHGAEEAVERLQSAASTFEHINVDLIYGWSGQTPAKWLADLQQVVELAGHLSLYNLTYEPQTVIGRRQKRGLLDVPKDDHLVGYYQTAMDYLAAEGFEHEEVSNWSRPGHSCRHNWLYWHNEFYLGIGTGAHGYIPKGSWGQRYAYPKRDRSYLTSNPWSLVEWEQPNSASDWLADSVLTGLRTKEGIGIDAMAARVQRPFEMTAALKSGVEEGQVFLANGRLTLTPSEWFREAAWAVEILKSFEA